MITKSLSAVERGNPPPRRKSCKNCIKSKRRCDLGIPTCTRCRQRQIQCSYPSRSDRNTIIPFDEQRPCGGDAVLSEPAIDNPPQLPERDSSVYNTQSIFTVGCESLPCVLQGQQNGLGDMMQSTFALTDTSLDIVQQTPDMLVPSRRRSFEFTFAAISSRLQFSIEQIVVTPRQMVLENQTPWCHPRLYIDFMPRSMQDALACCALYLAKNHINAQIIFSIIEAKVTDLLAAPEPITAIELLARTQALILYQIIRLFDGDILAMAAAATTSSALEAATLALMPHVEFYDTSIMEEGGMLELCPMTSTKKFWQSWVFQESARRTLLFSFFFLQMYRLLSENKPVRCGECKLYVYPSWTLSAHLWNAQSALDFAIAWTDKKHFVVTKKNFSEVLREANGDDLETFGKMQLTSAIGIDEAKMWLYSRGGTL
ncbi:transcription factor gsfR2 [Lipomyces kononenkoae]